MQKRHKVNHFVVQGCYAFAMNPRLCRSAALCALALAAAARAELKPASLFGDHMVLQRGRPVAVWGSGPPGETVAVSFAGRTATAKTDAGGKWSVRLKPLSTSAVPRTLTISSGREQVAIRDVLVGEVWVCSGQSNMELTAERGLLHPAEEIANARFPAIRLNLLGKYVSSRPLGEVESRWTETTPETMRVFSAAAYFFAREVYGKLKAPVGLIGAYYGGSNGQSWTRREVFEADPDLKIYLDEWEANAARGSAPPRPAPAAPSAFGERPTSDRGGNSRYRPSNFYNAMIAPLLGFPIRGVLWYQGEANTANARDAGLYARLFPAMIRDWRAQWGEGDFPFLYVQLPTSEPPYPEPTDSAWARVRESQEKALALKNTAMIVTIDIGEGAVVHARNKKQVGERLAASALNRVYGFRGIPDRYPRFRGLEIRDGKAMVRFTDAEGGLVCRNPAGLKGFAIAGADRNFVWAEAAIRGGAVEVWSPKVAAPVAVPPPAWLP
ncbi:MAG: sialate O-acetylesterase [Acidobacteriia bacterium]|nr:sialate O-acetylesterase [Terriglobia bacterium]